MDLLSQVLASTHLESSLICDLGLGGNAAIDYEIGSGSPAHFIVSGSCWFTAPDAAPIKLMAGDFIMLPLWQRHVLASNLAAVPMPIRSLVSQAGLPIWTPGELLDHPLSLTAGDKAQECRVLSLVFRVHDPESNPILRGLPQCVSLAPAGPTTRALMATILQFIRQDDNAGLQGYAAVSNRLADLVFAQVIREQLLSAPEHLTGLLRGLSDPALARALAALHEAPGLNWTIATMAAAGGLSRSIFAQRFHRLLGRTPHHYLIELRMQHAARVLHAGQRVKTVADQVGYATVQSFSDAFSRFHGVTPGKFRRDMLAASAAIIEA